MRRFSRISHLGAPHWVEWLDADRGLILGSAWSGETLDPERGSSQQELPPFSAGDWTYLPPFTGGSIFGLAYNYRSLVGEERAEEEPLFFLKSPSSAAGHRSPLQRPTSADKVWVEVELALVVGRRLRNGSLAEAREAILGVTVASDVTAENLYGRDHHLARSKALDGFAPMGPDLLVGIDTAHLEMSTHINGRRYQQGHTSDRLLDDAQSLQLISRFVTLEPGDMVLTGTPAGAMASLVKPGDHVQHTIENVGELAFDVVAAEDEEPS